MAENKIKNPIKVERETFEMDDKQYYSYFIRGTVRGKDVKVAIVPPDMLCWTSYLTEQWKPNSSLFLTK